jgi:beta-glucosidase/6-phospho-beta-glucosidase/beta-galactosidase
VELYRNKYQKKQGGKIGIALNHDFGVPLTNSDADIQGTQVHNEFYMGWFADPIFFGKYPDSMVERVGDRLPKFTREQSKRIRGSADFHAFNHYTAKYIYDPNSLPADANPLVSSGAPTTHLGGWFDDQGVVESKYSIDGQLIGEQGASPWLQVVPWGFYEVIMWNTRRYTIDGKVPAIYITENGCDVLHETEMTIAEALNDDFR